MEQMAGAPEGWALSLPPNSCLQEGAQRQVQTLPAKRILARLSLQELAEGLEY